MCTRTLAWKQCLLSAECNMPADTTQRTGQRCYARRQHSPGRQLRYVRRINLEAWSHRPSAPRAASSSPNRATASPHMEPLSQLCALADRSRSSAALPSSARLGRDSGGSGCGMCPRPCRRSASTPPSTCACTPFPRPVRWRVQDVAYVPFSADDIRSRACCRLGLSTTFDVAQLAWSR